MATRQSISSFLEPATHREWWLSWFGIFAGCTILAAGFVFFINPYNIVPGGVYGASIVLHNLFPSIQVGTFGYMFDIPLLILSVVLLGSKLGSRTVVAALGYVEPSDAYQHYRRYCHWRGMRHRGPQPGDDRRQ